MQNGTGLSAILSQSKFESLLTECGIAVTLSPAETAAFHKLIVKIFDLYHSNLVSQINSTLSKYAKGSTLISFEQKTASAINSLKKKR